MRLAHPLSRARIILLAQALALVMAPWALVAQESPAGAPQMESSAGETAVFANPAGDTIAVLRMGSALTVVESSGEWARVRLEGWIGRDRLAEMVPAERAGIVGLAELRSNPDGHVGQTVRWRVQFVARQRADHLRSDMEPGAHYLLVRDPGGEPGLVYVVVPEAMLSEIDALSPLQRVEITGRIVTGSSPLTGHPILELLELTQPPSER